MLLTIVRHGETIENRTRIQQGHLPGRLTDKGVKQAKKLGKRLKKLHFDVVYYSDLARVVDTAKRYFIHCPDIKRSDTPALREGYKGAMEGRSKDPDKSEKYRTQFNYKIGGGESINDVHQRVTAFLQKIEQKHPQDSVLLITHGGPLNIIYAHYSGIKLSESFDVINFKHTSVTTYQINKNPPHKLLLLNDTTHLD